MAENVAAITDRLSVMYTDDGDSRDSGYSDTMAAAEAGSTLFSLNDDICDMEEVFMAEDSNDSPTNYPCPKLCAVACEGIRKVISYGKPPIMKTTEKRTMIRSTTLIFPRKRAIATSEDCNIVDVKRIRRDVLTNIDNETPPSRKFSKPLQLRSFSRVNSTSVLEIKPQEEEKEPVHETVTKYTLPIVEVKDSTMAFRRLEASTLGSLMRTLTKEEFNAQFILVDCRYPYEFHGGHIQHAVNLYEQQECDDFFFDDKFDIKRIPIFYCEYSQKRGPTMATLLRSHDRCRNVDKYPNVTFKEIYVLDGGYKGFFGFAKEQQLESLCSPCAYISMDDYRFGMELRQFTFHRKYVRANVGIRIVPEKRRPKRSPRTQARRPLFKSKSSTIEITPIPSIPEEYPATPDLEPTRLNFSISSPESSFL